MTANGNVTLGGNRTVTVAASTLTLSGAIGDGGNGYSLTKSGAGTLVIGGANTFTGEIAVNGGLLKLSSVTLSGSNVVTLSGSGSFDIYSNYPTIAGLRDGASITTGTVFNSANPGRTLTLNVAGGNNFLYSGNIGTGAGTMGLIKTGSGTQTLAGNNTYTTTTTINAGTLKAGSTTAFSSASAFSLANTAGAVLDLNNFNNTIASLAGGGTTGGNVTLGSAILTTGNDNTSTTFSGRISGSGGLTKIGTGTLTLAGSNTFTGDITVMEGTLKGSNGNWLSSGTNVVYLGGIATTPTFDIGNNNTMIAGLNDTPGATTKGIVTNSGAASRTITVGGTGTYSYSGIITQSSAAINFIKSGSGTQTLSGSNSYTGTTSIKAGTLIVSGSLTIQSGAHLDLQIGRTSAFSAGGGNGTLRGDVSDKVTASGAVTLSSADLKLSLLPSTGYSLARNDVIFLLINGLGSSVTGTFTTLNGTTTNLGEGQFFTLGSQSFKITYQANYSTNSFTGGHDISLMMVPEPSSWLFLLAGLGMLSLFHRRREI